MPDLSTYDWRHLFPADEPSARQGHAMVWDGTRVILFGGSTSAFTAARSDETWEFSGGTWTQLAPATSPSARAFHNMVWDGSRILLFGGSDPGFNGETWEFSGGTWTQLFPAHSPSAREYFGMVWDGSRVLLYGGLTAAGPTFDGETWEYVGGDWNQLSPATSPALPEGGGGGSGRWRHRMIWDGTQVVLLGGRASFNAYSTNPAYETGGNTWVFSGGTWSQPSPATEPGERYAHMMTVTDDDNKAIIFSGDVSTTGSFGEIVDPATWVFDGTTWTDMGEVVNPGPRLDSDMVWAGDRVVLFGGDFYTSSSVHDVDAETWEYAVPSTDPVASLRHTFGLG